MDARIARINLGKAGLAAELHLYGTRLPTPFKLPKTPKRILRIDCLTRSYRSLNCNFLDDPQISDTVEISRWAMKQVPVSASSFLPLR